MGNFVAFKFLNIIIDRKNYNPEEKYTSDKYERRIYSYKTWGYIQQRHEWMVRLNCQYSTILTLKEKAI